MALSAILAALNNAYSFFAQTFLCGEPTWSVEEIPDLTGQIAIVTGGNAGIGKDTVKELLKHNAKVYMACRSEEKAIKAIKELQVITGKTAEFIQLDLADLKSVKAAVAAYTVKESQLHILINNAGVMYTPLEQITTDGYDMQFGTNVLGPFYFTKLLLPTLLATASQCPAGKVRVVSSTSSAHYIGAFEFASFKDGPVRRSRLLPETLYGQSKMGVVIFATELARRYGERGIISTSVNPGHVKSDLTRYMSPIKGAIVRYLQFYPVSYGALGQLYAATTAAGLALNGKVRPGALAACSALTAPQFLKPWATVGVPRASSQDPRLGRDLWQWLEDQVAPFEDATI
ncbi:hypothetical protein HWV62_19245 [Athelia sp. TMB]|nr:hypothetical protein HWV62_19245 [Athelia sp. TMB]